MTQERDTAFEQTLGLIRRFRAERGFNAEPHLCSFKALLAHLSTEVSEALRLVMYKPERDDLGLDVQSLLRAEIGDILFLAFTLANKSGLTGIGVRCLFDETLAKNERKYRTVVPDDSAER